MSLIYEPRGKAREYSPLALNLYTGCKHACRYCYAPSIMRQKLHVWAKNMKIRGGDEKSLLNSLDREAARMAGDKRDILLSFMTDPYCTPEAAATTRKALTILEAHKLRVQVLTKAPSRAKADFDIIARNGWKMATTLGFYSKAKAKQWEPYADSPLVRINAMKEAASQDIFTWVSAEPIIFPEEGLKAIKALAGYIDLIKIGKLNHNKALESRVDWGKFLGDAEALLHGTYTRWYVKKDLEKHRNTDKLDGQLTFEELEKFGSV